MALSDAHEGYEYQDLLSAYFILDWILEDVDSTFIIDVKENGFDRFDDLTVRNKLGIFKKQIKYSNEENSHTLVKSDLSSDSSYKLAIDELFKSWFTHPDRNLIDIKLCLAWNEPVDEITDVLVPSTARKTFKAHTTNLYKIDVQKLWASGKEPISSWRRFKAESKSINREDFCEFCERLTIETGLPKTSTDIYEPDQLEKIVLDQVDRLGIGIFPNNNWTKETFILALLALIKKSRSKGMSITTNEVFSKFQIKTDFGSVEQNFPIDYSKNIPLSKRISGFISTIIDDKKIILKGEPGSGKSWFVDNLISVLNERKIKTIKHYCYTDIQDKFQKERIQRNVFYGNLISDILNVYPYLKDKKEYKYASNLSELNLLIENIDEPTVLIIDGLDHIQRTFDYRPYGDIPADEIKIIDEINKIKSTEHLSILVASQPIIELDNIEGFKNYFIPTWTAYDVIELMGKLYLNDVEIEGELLSKLLLDKSAGNPLYLTYLIHELKGVSCINRGTISSLPPYSFNLKEYYQYLLSKLNLQEQVPQVMSAVNFSLTKAELKDITGVGTFVDDSLRLLLPVLKENHTSGGFIIYHESFRRFIIEYLKSKEIVEERIFRPIIDWFSKLDFYNYPKAYRYYLQVLNDGGYYEISSKFISKEFIRKSIYAGQSWDVIESNYYLLLKAATVIKDIGKTVLLNELSKALSTTEDSYDSSFLLYFEAMGCNYGFHRVADFLVFEGKPTLSLCQGLQVCYLIDSNKEVAPWDYYIGYFKDGESIQFEDFKFYVRHLLVSCNEEELCRMSQRLKDEELKDFESVFIKELKGFWNQEFIVELIGQNENLKSITLNNDSIVITKKQNLQNLADEILNYEHLGDSDIQKIKEFFKQIEIQIVDSELISQVVAKFSSINWFYNWLIYHIKILQLKSSKTKCSSGIREAFDILIYTTEPFLGEPRTCDLYYARDFIYQSLNGGLGLVQGRDDWKYVLGILEKVSNETTTSFQKSLGGPLSTEKLFEICLENINTENRSIIIELLERQYDEKKDYHLHSYISSYCFELSKVHSYNKESVLVEKYFKLGVDYMLGYTMRRDLTLEDLIESVETFNKLDGKLGNEYILKIKNLVDAVDEHTDGKDTKHFFVEWFKKFYNINRTDAILFLLSQLVNTRYDWRLESSLKHLLNNMSNNINVLTQCYLNQSLLVASDDLFLENTLDLLEEFKDCSARKTFVATVNSKIEIKQNSERSDSFHDKLSRYSDDFKFSKDYFSSIKVRKSRKIPSIDPIEKIKGECVPRKEFSEMSLNVLSEYLSENNILKNDMQSLIYIFDGFQNLDENLKNVIQKLIIKNGRYHDDDNVAISVLFESNSDISVYYWVASFVLQNDGWLKSLSNIEAFNNAYKLNPKKSLEFLFELLPNKLDLGFNRVFSANLLNALSKVDYDSPTLKKAWLDLYNMTESRLPTKDEFDWDAVLVNDLDMNLNELHICLLLSRFVSYTVQKFHIVLSGISSLLNDDSEQVIKPLKWFFLNHKLFKNSIQLAILELVYLYDEDNPGYIANFEFELKKIYPSNYYLIDYLIEDAFDLSEHISLMKDSVISYPISEDETNMFMGLSLRHHNLKRTGIDVRNIFGKFKETFSNKYQEYLELYGNRMHKQMVNNIYASDYLLELINIDHYNALKKFVNNFDVYEDLKIDVRSIIGQHISSSIRPKTLKKSSEYEEKFHFSNKIQNSNGWVRLAHFECELRKGNNYELMNSKIFGGITFQRDNKPIFPYAGYKLNMDYLWDEFSPNYEIKDTIIFSFIQKEFQIEDFKILWLNPVIVEMLELNVSEFHSGLHAMNDEGEVVLKFNSWCADYIASDYSDDIRHEIPKLDGSELVIREDYFKRICEMFTVEPIYSIYKRN